MKLVLALLFLCSTSLYAKNVVEHKDISYKLLTGKEEKNTLDIYAPVTQSNLKPVLVFVHGGSWNSGKKEIYKFLGKGFASKGIVTIIINYRLTPEVNYLPMTMDCAAAVKWVCDSISKYGGDPTNIYVAGHSAGGHLASLITNDNRYFDSLKIKNPIKGNILIDAFGLNMYTYFQTSQYKEDFSFKKTFTTNPEVWKKASPVYYLKTKSVPQLILVGGKTYTSIKQQSKEYFETAQGLKIKTVFQAVPSKGHIGMIFQFVRRKNPLYTTIIDFMR